MASEKILDVFLDYKSMGTLDLQGGASLDPRGLNGRNYVGEHYVAMTTRVPIQSAFPHA